MMCFINILLVYMFDRLGRREDETPFVLQWFVKQGIEVWSTHEGQQKFDNHVDKLLNYIRFWQASGESEKTATRIRTRHEQLTREGLWRGGVPAYGYRLEHNGRVSKKDVPVPDLAVDDEQAQIVHIIFRKMADEGYGTHRLAKYLNAAYPDPQKIWKATTINRIISNPVYTGRLSFGDLKTEPMASLRIVDDDLFQRAQQVLHGRAPWKQADGVPPQTGTKRLLNGLLRCGHCGQRLVGTIAREKRKRKDGSTVPKERPIYRCYGKETHGCSGQSLYSARRLEQAVDASLQEVFLEIRDISRKDVESFLSQNTLLVAYARVNEADAERLRLLSEEQLLKEEILKSLHGESALGKDLLNSMAEEVRTKREQAESQWEQATRALTTNEAKVAVNLQAFHALVKSAEEYAEATDERKRMILYEVVKQVTISKNYEMNINYKDTVMQFLNGMQNRSAR